MATLIAVHRPGGRTQRCDARCYDAHDTECEYICQGANHGVGLVKAIQQTRERREQWLEQARLRDSEIHHIELDLAVQSSPLF